MKNVIFVVLIGVLNFATGRADAQDVSCKDIANRKVSDYTVNNEGQQYAVNVMRVLFFVECNSTYSEIAKDLNAALDRTGYAYQLASKDDVLSEPTKSAFKDMLLQLDRLADRLESPHSSGQISAMSLRIQRVRIRALLGL